MLIYCDFQILYCHDYILTNRLRKLWARIAKVEQAFMLNETSINNASLSYQNHKCLHLTLPALAINSKMFTEFPAFTKCVIYAKNDVQ